MVQTTQLRTEIERVIPHDREDAGSCGGNEGSVGEMKETTYDCSPAVSPQSALTLQSSGQINKCWNYFSHMMVDCKI